MHHHRLVLRRWHYESDGEIGARTHYAVRPDPTKTCGYDRTDFRTATEAREFVRRANTAEEERVRQRLSDLESKPEETRT